ncbi:hypothetical protein Scep_021836 [Stephania cephalantha]|uniref:Uncharacterized protein n=1 Tax=Stephania cephalantha TaxID=152367 RepID=A0AAP0F6V4_9MAGN
MAWTGPSGGKRPRRTTRQQVREAWACKLDDQQRCGVDDAELQQDGKAAVTLVSLRINSGEANACDAD